MLRKTLLYLLVAVLLVMTVPATQPASAQERPVLAFYYGWFNGGTWSDGRLIDRPAEQYDSGDTGVMARQIGQARSAGIDGFVMSVYGPASSINMNIFQSLMDQAAAQGFSIAADVDLGSAEFNTTPDQVLETMRDLIANRVNHPAYFRYNGKPVIFFWNQGRFDGATWQAIRAQVDPAHNTTWIVEGASLEYLPTFDGLHLYNTAWSASPASTAATWTQRTHNAGGLYVATAMPGWDDLRMGRGDAGFAVDRAAGGYYQNSFSGAAAAGADMLIITSWNEYFENTHIEPSQTYGSYYLDLTRQYITSYKGAAPADSSPSAAAPSGITASPTVEGLNVRHTPSTSAPIVGMVFGGSSYAIIGRTAASDWWQISFDGGQGWIASGYATYQGGDINGVPVTQ